MLRGLQKREYGDMGVWGAPDSRPQGAFARMLKEAQGGQGCQEDEGAGASRRRPPNILGAALLTVFTWGRLRA